MCRGQKSRQGGVTFVKVHLRFYLVELSSEIVDEKSEK